MHKLTILAALALSACSIGPDADGRTPVNTYVLTPDGGTVRAQGTPEGYQRISPAAERVGTACLQAATLATPDGGTIAPVQDQRYRGMAHGAAVCVANGLQPTSCSGLPLFAADSPEEVAWGPLPDGGAPQLYFLTESGNGTYQLCPLTEVAR